MSASSRALLASSPLLLLPLLVAAVSGFSVRWESSLDRGGEAGGDLGSRQGVKVYPADTGVGVLLQADRPRTASSSNTDAMTKARRLLNKLQRLDLHLEDYVNQVLHQTSPSDVNIRRGTSQEELRQSSLRQGQRMQSLGPSAIVNHSVLDPLPDVDVRSAFKDILPTIKRQSSSGAQICIWKVCPPSPWRRNGRPQIG